MTRPPSGVITSPSISQARLSPSLPLHFLLPAPVHSSSLEENYWDGVEDWLSWATTWCLFQHRGKSLEPTIQYRWRRKHKQPILRPCIDLRRRTRTFNGPSLASTLDSCSQSNQGPGVTAEKTLKNNLQDYCLNMPACVRDRFHTVFLVNDGWRVTHSDAPLGERGEERGREGRWRQPEVREAQDRKKKQKNKRGASLLKCGKTGELIENDKVRDNKQKDLSSGWEGRSGQGRLYLAAAECHVSFSAVGSSRWGNNLPVYDTSMCSSFIQF